MARVTQYDVLGWHVRYAPDAPEEFKAFLTKKQRENKQLLEFYTGEPDVSRFASLRWAHLDDL
jgi:hypothetical protein